MYYEPPEGQNGCRESTESSSVGFITADARSPEQPPNFVQVYAPGLRGGGYGLVVNIKFHYKIG